MATPPNGGWDRLDSGIAGSTLLVFISDILLWPSDILLPLLYFVPVGLSAFSSRVGLTTMTALAAIIFTAAGHGYVPTTSPISQAANRALVISMLFLAPPFLGMLKLMTTGRNVLLASKFIAWLKQSAPALRDELEPHQVGASTTAPGHRKHYARYN